MTAAALLIGSLLGCGLIAAVCSVAVAVGRVASAINYHGGRAAARADGQGPRT